MKTNPGKEPEIAAMIAEQCFDKATLPPAASASQAGEEHSTCAKVIDECLQSATAQSNSASQPLPSTRTGSLHKNVSAKTTQKKMSLPPSMRHNVRPEVLSSLPLRPRPSRQAARKTTAEHSYVTRSKIKSTQATGSDETCSKIGSSQATGSHQTRSKIGSSQATVSHAALSKIGSSQATGSHAIRSKIDFSQGTGSHATRSTIGSSQATGSHVTRHKIGSSQATGTTPVSTENEMLSRYQRQCVSDIQEGSDLHKTVFRGKEYYVVALSIKSSEELDAFQYPPIAYRRVCSAEDNKIFEDRIRETGPSDKFGTISVIHDKTLTGIIVDGKRRHQAYKKLIREKILGIGDVDPNTIDSFRWHREHLTIRLFVPVSLLPPKDAEILSLSIALNGDKTDSTPLSDADVYSMLQKFAIYYYGNKKTVTFYHGKAMELVKRAMSANLLDHLLPRQRRTVQDSEERGQEQGQSSKSPKTPVQSNRKQIYSRYIRSSISFFNQLSAYNLVFNKFGFTCPLWCKELFCWERFLEMDETEMTVSLALLAKRYTERRRKENFDMSVADAKKVIELVMDILNVVETVAKTEKALDSSSWTHWLGAHLEHRKDKNVARQPYIYSLAFFVCKWNERTIWKKDLILKEVKRDRLQWPSNRQWRGETFKLEDFDESFFRTELHPRKQFETKRKRKSDGNTNARRTKRKRIVEKDNLQDLESDDDYTHEEEKGKDVQPDQRGQEQDRAEVQAVKEASPTNCVNQENTTNPSVALERPSASTTTVATKHTDPNDCTQLSGFMDFILNKAGVQDKSKIDVARLMKLQSSAFIDQIIQNLQEYGTKMNDGSNGQGQVVKAINKSVPSDSESNDNNYEDDEDNEFLDKTKEIWAVLEKQYKENSNCQEFLPEPCQGKGLWGRLLLPGIIVELKEEVRMAIFRSRKAKCGTDDDTNELILNMFKEIRAMEMRYQGFTVCQAFLTNEGPKDWVDSFLSYYMNFFTGKDGTGKVRKGKQCPWESIANIGVKEDSEPLKRGIGRFQVSSIEDVEYLTKNQMGLYRKKLMLEVFVAQLISSIISSKNSPLRFPCFGSKLLVHTADAKSQRLHCDYPVRKDGVLEECDVKYFAIVTGKKSSLLHVLPMGHWEISRRDGKRISEIDSKLIEVPPYSVGIFRGDLPHGGAGADDDIKRRGKFEFSPRVHFYVDRPADQDNLVMEPSLLFYPK